MKPWWKSRTIWLNLLMTLAPIMGYAAESVGLLQQFMTPPKFAVYSMLVGFANVALRSITTQGVSLFAEKPE